MSLALGPSPYMKERPDEDDIVHVPLRFILLAMRRFLTRRTAAAAMRSTSAMTIPAIAPGGKPLETGDWITPSWSPTGDEAGESEGRLVSVVTVEVGTCDVIVTSVVTNEVDDGATVVVFVAVTVLIGRVVVDPLVP